MLKPLEFVAGPSGMMSFGDPPTSASVATPPLSFWPFTTEPPPTLPPAPAAQAAIRVVRARAATTAVSRWVLRMRQLLRPDTPAARESLDFLHFLYGCLARFREGRQRGLTRL